jgi:DNA-binding transcriptional LysR family regulator
MVIRQLVYLAALARERHFGRAAAACNISQPSLSAAIRQLEEELGVPIVERGHRFNGLTPEGEHVLASAKRILGESDNLRQTLASLRKGLSGKLRLGVIPTALMMVPDLTAPFLQRYPAVTFKITSMTSKEIQRGIDNFELDAGLTYLDNEPLGQVRKKPLHYQKFAVLARRDGPLGGRATISWSEASELKLCLLTPDMQNRRIIDDVFRTLGCRPIPVLETNSILNLCSHAALPGMASIVPSQLLHSAFLPEEVRSIALVMPEVQHTIGLIMADREPSSPLAQILFDIAAPIEPSSLA